LAQRCRSNERRLRMAARKILTIAAAIAAIRRMRTRARQLSRRLSFSRFGRSPRRKHITCSSR
jgi:hypothetical protein